MQTLQRAPAWHAGGPHHISGTDVENGTMSRVGDPDGGVGHGIVAGFGGSECPTNAQ